MNNLEKEIIVITHAYLSGSFLAPEFLKKGFKCLHVTTKVSWQNNSYQESFNEKDFIKTILIENEDQIDSVINELKKYRIKLIIPGAESGVILADKLAYRLGTCVNNFETSSARRNKFEMQEVLRKNQLRSIFQMKTTSLEEIIKWKKENGLQRIVLKPLKSAASDGVFYCDNNDVIKDAFELILGKKDILGNENKEVLVQEYIDGFEYIVNTVTCNGQHLFLDVWKGHSLDTSKVSNDIYADIVSPDEADYKIICKYLSNVLDVLGIKGGPAHSEVRVDKNGACLIEVGARLAGRVDFSAVEAIYGCSQLSLSVDAFLNPEKFLAKVGDEMAPKKHARYVYFFSNIDGAIKQEVEVTDFLKLETLFSIKLYLKKDDFLRKTSKSLGIKRPGFAYLISDSQDKIESDYLVIKLIENDFYKSLVG